MPGEPERAYRNDGWQGYPHWLGSVPTTFVETDHDPPVVGFEAQEEDGSWRPIHTYVHTRMGNVVLWFGGDEYEGVGGSYQWTDHVQQTNLHGHGGKPRAPELKRL